MEWREARRLAKPTLIFLLGESVPRSEAPVDREDGDRARVFRERLQEVSVGAFTYSFTSEDDLREKIAAAVSDWNRENAKRAIVVGVADLELAWRLVVGFKATHDLLQHLEPAAFGAAIEKWERDKGLTNDVPWPERLARALSGLQSTQTDHFPSELWLAWMRTTRFTPPPGGAPTPVP